MRKYLPTVQWKIQKITHNLLVPSAQLKKTLGVRSLCISPLFNELHMLANCWVIRIWDFINKKKGTLAISTTLPCVLGCIAKYQHCNSMLCTMYTSYNLGKMTAVEMKMICKCLHSKSPWRTLETKYVKIGMKTREGISMKSPVFWTRSLAGPVSAGPEICPSTNVIVKTC